MFIVFSSLLCNDDEAGERRKDCKAVAVLE
jgi:hypothetical protein